MIALMEKTAWESVAPYLGEDEGTVGTLLNVAHLSATPLNMVVRCESELVEIDGRKLVFKVAAYDEVIHCRKYFDKRYKLLSKYFFCKNQPRVRCVAGFLKEGNNETSVYTIGEVKNLYEYALLPSYM